MRDWLGPAAHLTGIGWFVGTAILLGVLLGRWGDGQLGTEPVFTLIGVIVGLAVALVGGVQMLLQFLSLSETKGTDRSEKR